VDRIPAYFHSKQLEFKPVYEWAMGRRIDHPETTARAESILAALESAETFEMIEPESHPLAAIREVHSYQLLTLYNTARHLEDDFYPSVFPRELREMGDPTNIRHAGCYCFDSGTPLNNMTFEAAAWSAGCAYDAAGKLAGGAPLVYSLSRPPGHHATEQFFGGYSYFNNSVIAAKRLSQHGRVAVLDIDFHHGNGTQSIFYRDPSVLTVSIHGDPTHFFPFYCGFSNETGEGEGAGYNLNFCLPAKTTLEAYLETLEEALEAVAHFDAELLVLAAGFDGYKLDPIGDWLLETEDYSAIGEHISRLGLPTLVVQEGGYYTDHLGRNAVALLSALR